MRCLRARRSKLQAQAGLVDATVALPVEANGLGLVNVLPVALGTPAPRRRYRERKHNDWMRCHEHSTRLTGRGKAASTKSQLDPARVPILDMLPVPAVGWIW